MRRNYYKVTYVTEETEIKLLSPEERGLLIRNTQKKVYTCLPLENGVVRHISSSRFAGNTRRRFA